jgi:hypothetical protein
MALIKIPKEMGSTPGIVDNSNATAITIDSSESTTFAGSVSISHGAGDSLTLTKTTTEPSLRLEGDTNKDFVITVSGELLTITQNDGTTDLLTLDHDTKVATFSSTVTATALNLNTSGTSSFSIINGGTNAIAIKAAAGDELYIGANNTYALRLLNDGTNNVVMDNGGGFHVGGLFIHANRISSGYTSDSEDADVWINYQGYNGGATRFRDFRVGNGKQGQVLLVDGSSGDVSITDGNLIVAAGHGIDFSANANAGGAAGELLDDYEYGTWTPVIPGCTISIGRANYVKIGGLVKLDFNVVITGNDSSGAAMTITGVPFTATTANSESSANPMLRYFNFDSGTTDVLMYHYSRVATIEFYEVADDSNWSVLRRDQITNNSAAIIGTLIITVD